MAPRFRNGYDKHLDVTEEEYLLAQAEAYYDESEPEHEAHMFEVVAEVWVDTFEEQCPGCGGHAVCSCLEGEPNEDTYFPGIPDYDRFNRPSWGEEE